MNPPIPHEFPARQTGLSLIDKKGRMYVRHKYLSAHWNPHSVPEQELHTYKDLYGFKEYGCIGRDSQLFLYELGGDLEKWIKKGVSTWLPEPPDYGSPECNGYFERQERIMNNDMVLRAGDTTTTLQRPVHIRRDWLCQHSSAYSASRANRPQKPLKSPKWDPSTSVLHPDKIRVKTPEPRMWFYQLHIDGDYVPGSVPNLYPFLPEHRVNAFAGPRLKLSDFIPEDFENYLRMTKTNAYILHCNGAQGIITGINIGVLAAASQDVIHSQDGEWIREMLTRNAKEVERYCDMCRYEDDPFGYHMNIARRSKLFGFETEHTLVFAPFAPRFPDHVDIILKPRVHHILELPEGSIRDIAGSITRVLHTLYNERGVKDANIAVHQTMFGDENGYRMHFHIYPRNKNRMGVFELEDLFVVDVSPETTADALRNAA